LRFHLNQPSRPGVPALPHAHTGCHRPRTGFADASTAWRRSPQMDAEPQPHCGALAAAAAGSAGFAVETPYATAAAASDAPRIEIIDRNNSPALEAETALPFSAPAKRPRRMGQCSEVADGGGNLQDRPRPRGADTFAARPRFSGQIARQFVSGRVEPFSLSPDKTLPGTLHHSGIKPAPPSDHIPLVRRSVFQRQNAGPERNRDAPAGSGRLRAATSAVPTSGKCICPLCGISIFVVPPSAVAEASGAASNQRSIGELKRTERLPAS
jgi:hypothetical protein